MPKKVRLEKLLTKIMKNSSTLKKIYAESIKAKLLEKKLYIIKCKRVVPNWSRERYGLLGPSWIHCWVTCYIMFFLGFLEIVPKRTKDSWFSYITVYLNRYVSLRLRVQNRRKNGISHLISALCVNCLISIPEYSRIIDYSIIWMCIWCGLLQKLYKIKKSELLNSKVYSKV